MLAGIANLEPTEFVGITTIRYPDTPESQVRGPLFVKTLTTAVNSWVQMVILNGGVASPDLLAQIRKIGYDSPVRPIWIHETDLGAEAKPFLHTDWKLTLGSGRRYIAHRAHQLAPKRPIIWLEPEKDILHPATLASIRTWLKTASILVGRRDPQLFQDSYPPQQHQVESEGNQEFHTLLRDAISAWQPTLLDASGQPIIPEAPLDYWSGPKVWTPKAIKHFIEYPGHGWDVLLASMYRALRTGHRLGEFDMYGPDGPWSYPPAQRDLEATGDAAAYEAKRLAQKRNILDATQAEIARVNLQMGMA